MLAHEKLRGRDAKTGENSTETQPRHDVKTEKVA